MVCDRYFESSLNEGVQHNRGSGTKINFDENSRFPASFSEDFLRTSENKEELNIFLAQKFIKLHEHKSQILLYRRRSRSQTLRHDIHQANTGLKNIMIKTVDTDVFLLAIAYCSKLIAWV